MAQYANPQQFGAPMGDHNNDGGYMEQDEEWEREGLLDPAWEKQQRKVSVQMACREIYTVFLYEMWPTLVQWLKLLWGDVIGTLRILCYATIIPLKLYKEIFQMFQSLQH